MGKLVEATHVTLGGQIDALDEWAFPYLDDEHNRYATRLLTGADALLLGRATYEGLSAAYTRMADEAPPGVPTGFIDRMNEIPKLVASRSLEQLSWNATRIDVDVASFVADRKRSGMNLLKYGNGALDATLMQRRLVDEFHLFLTPVAGGRGQRLFERIEPAPHLVLRETTPFESGVVVLVYAPA
jgi:dihydrofolate reductase